MKKRQDKAIIYFTDGSQQAAWDLEIEKDYGGVFYYWEHETKEIHSFVPFQAIKRIDNED